MGFKGLFIRQSADRIEFTEVLKDATGPITSGTTSLKIYELQNDGTLKSYDFNDNTFKTTALTTDTASMTHRTGNNGTVNTGLWSYSLTTVSGFTLGNIYISSVSNTANMPATIEREFQYGTVDGDQSMTTVPYLDINVAAITSDTTAATRLENLHGVLSQGTVDDSGFSPTTTQFETSITTNKDIFTNEYIYFASGTNTGFTAKVTGYAYTTKVKLTVSTLQAAPANADIFIIIGKGA
jgi:hypothetical protein